MLLQLSLASLRQLSSDNREVTILIQICPGIIGNYIERFFLVLSLDNNFESSIPILSAPTYTDMVFIQQMEWDDGTFYLSFREKTKEEKLAAAIAANASSVTDVQVALAEVYEMILGGN